MNKRTIALAILVFFISGLSLALIAYADISDENPDAKPKNCKEKCDIEAKSCIDKCKEKSDDMSSQCFLDCGYTRTLCKRQCPK